ncbi:MAG: ABC transporter permease [Hamadaea sp.]|uniref:ABC transporter permease n=1 Tax=Hamadaea sp. TaxID=2024425 RepID=UPI0017D30632|nr:ABC transporter permease [Hamadaea sp.]NUR72398.1 ABC transporter permease [Hamadaea sp.]NUT22164.1 ABC transporter permease [Hamadaea sp.]
MLRFFVKRALLAVLTLFAISVTVFVLFFMGPADPAASMCGSKACTMAQHEQIVKSLELDKSPVTQYASYMRGVFVGREIGSDSLKIKCEAPCLGVNFRTYEPVKDIIGRTLPITFSIVLGAAVVYVLFGTALGMISAIWRGSIFDRLAAGTALTFASTQIFFLGSLILLIFVYKTGWLPRPQYISPSTDFFGWIGGMLTPWIALGLINSASYSRFSRAQMIETLGEDYIRTARAKGLGMRAVYFRHALRAAITPIVTIAGIDIGGQLGGVAITETTFSLPGMGKTALGAVVSQNLPIVMAVVLFGAVFIVLSNVIVDMLYAVIDPRVKLGSSGR